MPKNTSAYMSDFNYHVKDYDYAPGYRGLAIGKFGRLLVNLKLQFLCVSIGCTVLNVDLFPL